MRRYFQTTILSGLALAIIFVLAGCEDPAASDMATPTLASPPSPTATVRRPAPTPTQIPPPTSTPLQVAQIATSAATHAPTIPVNAGFRERCDGPGESLDTRPARRVTKVDDTVVLDDTKPDMDWDNTFANAAHRYARKADDFFLLLSSEGLGAWNGCYGSRGNGDQKPNQTPIMTSVVQPERQGTIIKSPKLTTSWQVGWVAYEKGESLTPQAAYHEWTHGLVDNTIGLSTVGPESCGDGCLPGQSGALAESLSDVFQALLSGKYELAQTETIRSMSNPQDFGDPDIMAGYVTKELGPLCHHPDFFCKYQNAGIPNKAAYLMIEGSKSEDDKKRFGNLTGLGRDKVARIYFHALQPRYLSSTPTFVEFAQGVFDACTDLETREIGGITTDVCTNAKKAFQAVGMLPVSISTATSTASMAFTMKSAEGRWDIYVMSPNQDQDRNVTQGVDELDKGSLIWDMAWSPDGTRVAFSFDARGVGGIVKRDIYLLDADDRNLRKLSNNPDDDYGPSWSPDGTQIVYVSRRNEQYDLYIANADGPELRQLTNDPVREQSVDWSPDGTRVAYDSNPAGRMEIFVMWLDTKRVQQITTHSGMSQAGGPKWSRDSKRIAYWEEAGAGFDLHVLDADGGSNRRLVSSPHGAGEISWSLDGKTIAFGTVSDIYTTEVDNPGEALFRAGASNPCWLP